MIKLTKDEVLEIAEAGRAIGAGDLYVEEGGGIVLADRHMLRFAFKAPPAALKAAWRLVDFGFVAKAAGRPSLAGMEIGAESASALFEGSAAKTPVRALGVFPDTGFTAPPVWHKAPQADTRRLAEALADSRENPNAAETAIRLTAGFAEATNKRILIRVNFKGAEGAPDCLMPPDTARLALGGLDYAVIPDKRGGPAAVAVRLASGWQCMSACPQRQYPPTDAFIGRWAAAETVADIAAAPVLKLLGDSVIEHEVIIISENAVTLQSRHGESVQRFDTPIVTGGASWRFSTGYMETFLKHCAASGADTFSIRTMPSGDTASTTAWFSTESGTGVVSALQLV